MNFKVNSLDLSGIQSGSACGVKNEFLGGIFRRGAIFEAYVVKRTVDGVVLQVGGELLTARTETDVTVDSYLLLRVKSVSPRIELEILSMKEAEPGMSGIRRYLLLHHSDSQRFSRLLMGYFTCVDALKDVSLKSREVISEHTRRIDHLLKLLVFCGGNGDDRFSIREYAKHLGLLLESGLLKILQGNAPDSKIRERAGLKGECLAFRQVLRNLMDGTDGDLERGLIEQFLKNVEETVETIEALQVLNVLAEDQNYPYYFPIPVAISDKLVQQDLFVDCWRRNEYVDERTYHFVMFLSPDMLGDIFVEVWIRGNSINCHIRCGEKSTHVEVSGQLPILKSLLINAGFFTTSFTCSYEDDLSNKITDYRRKQFVNKAESLSIFA